MKGAVKWYWLFRWTPLSEAVISGTWDIIPLITCNNYCHVLSVPSLFCIRSSNDFDERRFVVPANSSIMAHAFIPVAKMDTIEDCWQSIVHLEKQNMFLSGLQRELTVIINTFISQKKNPSLLFPRSPYTLIQKTNYPSIKCLFLC